MRQRPIRRLYRLTITGISIIAVIIGLKYILPLCLPFVFGYFLAWIAAPIVRALTMRFHLHRGVASVSVVTIFLLLLMVVIYFVVHAGVHQVKMFFENLPLYQEMSLHSLERICPRLDRMLSVNPGTCYQSFLNFSDKFRDMVQSRPMNGMEQKAFDVIRMIFDIIWNLVIVFISALLWVKDFDVYKQEWKESCYYKEVHMVTKVLSDMGIAYLKAQLILLCITSLICMIGIFFTGNGYAILIGLGIGIFDAFPILGSAFILIPWVVILFVKKQFTKAVILLITYVICQLTRQVIEPKLVGDGIGVRSIYILISMYIGLKIYGGFGFILGPITLIAIKAIVNTALHTKSTKSVEEAEKTNG